MSDQELPRWVTIKQAAEYYQLDTKTIRRMITHGKLKARRIGSRSVCPATGSPPNSTVQLRALSRAEFGRRSTTDSSESPGVPLGTTAPQDNPRRRVKALGRATQRAWGWRAVQSELGDDNS